MISSRPILLVDDNEDDVFFMRRGLKNAAIGNPLFVAEHGQAAIDFLAGNGEFADRRQYPLPFLIFLDLKMPVKSGLEVLEWIRQQRALQGILILILSTSREESDVQRAYSLGANSYLVKPPNAALLTELLRLVKNYWIDNPQIAIPSRRSSTPSAEVSA